MIIMTYKIASCLAMTIQRIVYYDVFEPETMNCDRELITLLSRGKLLFRHGSYYRQFA